MKRVRTVLQIGAPIVAILTLMIGLRIGAGEDVRAATVFGAPVGRPAPDGRTRVAWQILTFFDSRGVKETIPMRGLSVVARSKGREARWEGSSNADGVAEMALEMEDLKHGDPLELEVRVAGDVAPIAAGHVSWNGAAPEERKIGAETAAAARPTVRSGAIAMDVVIEGERLIAGFPTNLWVRVTPPAGMAKVGWVVEVDPEPGLLASHLEATTCGAGWAEFPVTAQAHVTGAGFVARPAGGSGRAGTGTGTPETDAGVGDGGAAAAGGAGGKWFGALPVAAGAFFISVPRWLEEGKPGTAVLIAPNPRDVVYAELNDTRGRVAAVALPVLTEKGDPTPRARFELPPLAAGVYWLVVSGEPRGAERLAGAAVAKTILVGEGGGGGAEVSVHDACSLGPWLAQRPAQGFPRWVALDGLPSRSVSNLFRHRLGLFIALVSLLAAGVLETLLLIAASREARISLQLTALDEDDPTALKVTASTPGGGVLVAVLIVVLGLALLAALLVAKG